MNRIIVLTLLAITGNAGDGVAYAKYIAPDVSFTKGTTKIMNVRKARFVTPDVVIVDIDNEIHGVKTMPAGIPVPADGVLKTQLMEVFVRHGSGWQVEAYHNVDVKEAAATQK
jgi:hypothetical protein